MKDLFEFLNGHKTIIGLFLWQVGKAQLGDLALWEIFPPETAFVLKVILQTIQDFILWFGGILAAVGAAHKGKKYLDHRKAKNGGSNVQKDS